VATCRGGAAGVVRGGVGAAAGASTVAGAVGRMTRGSVLGDSGAGLAATVRAGAGVEGGGAGGAGFEEAAAVAGGCAVGGATGRATEVAGAATGGGCKATVTGARGAAGRERTGAVPLPVTPAVLFRLPGGVSRTGPDGLLNGSR
ncbi:MAG: hypothetical protein P1U37_02890, partial [Minwuia sp.]|nr:hypothetical protein [Minwuia sp.]